MGWNDQPSARSVCGGHGMIGTVVYVVSAALALFALKNF